VGTIVKMIWVSRQAFSGPEFALELFLDDTGITKEEKKEALTKIHAACEEKALIYTNLSQITKERLQKL
jgi:glycerol dehydrogenase-like iron-containing ADH family enzyme